jgi:hypothetical protein
LPDESAILEQQRKRDDDDALLLLWAAHVGSQYKGLLTGDGWTFDPSSQFYISDTNHKLSDDELRSLAIHFIGGVSGEMRDSAVKMLNDGINPESVAEWKAEQQRKAEDEYLLLSMLGAGGGSHINQSDLDVVAGHPTTPKTPGAGVLDAEVRLKDFASKIEAGTAGSEAEIVHRAGMYAEPGYGVFETIRRDSHQRMAAAKGLNLQELNVLDDGAAHCRAGSFTLSCPQCTAAGWTAIGSLPDVGLRSCGPMCRCHLIFRIAPKDKPT